MGPEYWPEFEAAEREGRLLLGGSPRARRGNAVGLAVALLVALPTLLAFLWIGGLDAPVLACLGALSVTGGLIAASKAAWGDWEFREDRDFVFDRAANQVTKSGVRVCAVTEVARVELFEHPRSPSQNHLTLVMHALPGVPEQGVRMLAGSDLAGPGKQVAEYLGVLFTVRRRNP